MNKFILAALFCSLLTPMAFAKGMGKGKGEFAQKMKAELNLTDEQLEKIKEVRKSSKGQHKEMRAQMKAARADLHAALGNPKVSKDELLAKFNKLEALKSEMSRKRFETMLAIRTQLDESQIAKFHELHKSRKKEWRSKLKDEKEAE